MLLTSSWIPDLALLFGAISFIIYKYSTRNFDYFKKRNILYQEPLPILGNFKDVVLLKETLGEWLKKAYDNALKVPFFGIFVFDEPYLVLKDPELIKSVLIKDFANFSDRNTANPTHNKVTANFLFMMRNPQWRIARSELSPAFTSGKLKGMFPIISEVGEDLQKYLYEHQGILEAKEVASKYSTDVIAKCFFGINSHCFDNENAMFRVLGRSIFDFSLRNAFSQMAYFSTPNLVKWFKIDFFESWVVDYFVDSFSKAFASRENSKQRKNDFIDILKDMKKKGEIKGDFQMSKIEGSSMQFFAAGFETTSSTISYTLYELSLNKSMQNKLRSEIMSSIKENQGLTYESISNMKYLNMCIKETLRKYPVLPFLDRKSLNDYKLPGTDIVIAKGTGVYIPMFGLHYDEQYFPEPNKYDPERFTETNNNYNSNGLVYVPFGDGPRICIGERFGLISAKLGVISVLTKFEVEKCDKTPDPVEFEPKSLVLQSKVGLPLTFKYLVPSPA